MSADGCIQGELSVRDGTSVHPEQATAADLWPAALHCRISISQKVGWGDCVGHLARPMCSS